MPITLSNTSLYEEIHNWTSTEDAARDFLFNRNILKPPLTCSSCSSLMTLQSCSSTKSADLFTWKCPSCKKFKGVRSGSVLAGTNLSFRLFLTLLFHFHLSIRSLTWRLQLLRD